MIFAPYFYSISLHQAPADPEIWKRWFNFVAKTRQDITNLHTLHICSDHFTDADFLIHQWLLHPPFAKPSNILVDVDVKRKDSIKRRRKKTVDKFSLSRVSKSLTIPFVELFQFSI